MSYLGQVELKSSEIRRIDVTGSTSATHTLTWTPASEQSLIITINGIKQQNNYSIAGTTLTLDDALLSADKMEVIGILDIGEAVVPPDDSITNAMVNSSAAIAQSKLATLAIDTAELADDAVTADKLANSINTEIAANTAKVTNATHTGDVTGATALTIATDAVDIAMLSATGTADATTFLRGDNAWAAAASPGDLTPAFMVYLDGDDTVSSGGVERLNFNGEMYDTDNAYDHTTNYRFTVPAGEGGAYVFFFQTMIQDAGGDYDIDHLEPKMSVNGTARWAYTELMNSDLERKYFTVHGGPIILDLAAADYVDCHCYVHTIDGGDLKFLGPGSFSGGTWYGRTYFWGHKLPGVS